MKRLGWTLLGAVLGCIGGVFAGAAVTEVIGRGAGLYLAPLVMLAGVVVGGVWGWRR